MISSYRLDRPYKGHGPMLWSESETNSFISVIWVAKLASVWMFSQKLNRYQNDAMVLKSLPPVNLFENQPHK